MSPHHSIPDMLATWPWKTEVNPMLNEVKDEANTWVTSLALFEPAELQKFHACDFNLLAALVAPHLESKERLRITCDLGNLYFAFDEHTDVANKPEAIRIANDVMDAFRRRKGSTHPSSDKIAAMAQAFIERTVSVLGEDVAGMERFISDFDAYTKSVTVEADDRATGHVRTFNEYMILRRDTCGAKPTFSFLGLGLDIPDAVFEHPLIMSLIENASDLIAITNDTHSYSLERSRGLHGHNIISTVMQEYHLDLQQALYWIYGYSSNIISNFLRNDRALPSWGEEIDQRVREYIDRMARCVRGHDTWSHKSHRYYGSHGSVREHRKIALLPPNSGFITRKHLGLEIL